MPSRLRPHSCSGFAILELIVVLLILALMAGVVAPRVGEERAAERDARRMQDVGALVRAIEQYHEQTGEYPPNDGSGWSSSTEEHFLAALVEAGIVREVPRDPVNDDVFRYCYYRYEAGSYGAPGESPFYVLGIRTFESERARAREHENFELPERDFGDELHYALGGGVQP